MSDLNVGTRKRLRLAHYDYSANGMYFITICSQAKRKVFGSVFDGSVSLNDTGMLVEKWINKIPEKYENVLVDKYVVMPNHIHCMICIESLQDKVGHTGPTLHNTKTSISDVVRWLKTMITNEYINNVKEYGWEPFYKRFFHKSFYDRIIRNEQEYLNVMEYIQNNPVQWELDVENDIKNIDEKIYYDNIFKK